MCEFGFGTRSKMYGKVLSLDWLKHDLRCVCGIFPSVAIFEANVRVWKTMWSCGIVIMNLRWYSVRKVVG